MLIQIKQGMTVPVAGAPRQEIVAGVEPQRVALVGADYLDLRAGLQVAVDDRVQAGQPLFVNRADPSVRFVAPGAGRVVEINRGPKRSLLSVVVELDGDAAIKFPELPQSHSAELARDVICQILLDAGLWPALRARPYGRVAHTSALPTALFVTAIDTDPLAARPEVVVLERSEDFSAGLAAISRLAPATWLCAAPGADLPCPDLPGLGMVEFAGEHPAGLVGTHVRHLHPEGSEVWHIGYQDLLAVGHLFRTGELSHERVISLAGPGVFDPRLIRTRAGVDLRGLLESQTSVGCRIISGSVLSGHAVTPGTAFLGRYHNQVSVLDAEARAGSSPGGMLPLESFDRVWPFAVPPGPLLRALLIRDTETAGALGCLALIEEDLALCSYVCPAKLDYGSALRDTLREIERGR
ncbi:MAG: NADH:ubiquinone reductase (Na(+)-transporting) subunit A [Gammaproteobacteria bacterium]|nr:NADH:ubiquinone reductase (Na(+)-transporting) subunit A [Gammaproteobacteria bacterium]